MPNSVDVFGYSYQSGRWTPLNVGTGGEAHMVGYGENRLLAIKATYHEKVVQTATAGTNQVSGVAVPANQVYVINNMDFRDSQTALTQLVVMVTDNVNAQVVIQTGSVAAGFHTPANGLGLYIPAGWFIRAIAVGCALNDTLTFEANGYKMDI